MYGGKVYSVLEYDVACFDALCGESKLVRGDLGTQAYLAAQGKQVVSDINTLSGEVATWGAATPLGLPAAAVNTVTSIALDDGYGLFSNAFGFLTAKVAKTYGAMDGFWSEMAGAYTGRAVSEATK